MLNGMIGRKIGMTQIFEGDGSVVPVTVIKAGPASVVQKKTVDNDGYDSVQLGFEPIPERKLTRPKKGHLKGHAPVRFLKEVQAVNIDQIEVGQMFDVSLFEEGQMISVTGISKGKGFAGVMKRHNFSGHPRTHGSRGHRNPGSIGQCAFPSKVFKGKKMPGHYGNNQVTVGGLKIVKIIPEEHLMLVKGAIPGRNGGVVTIKKNK